MQIRHTAIYTHRNKEHSLRIPLSHKAAILILPCFIIQTFIYTEEINLEIKIISELGRLKARCSLTDLLSNSLQVKIQQTNKQTNKQKTEKPDLTKQTLKCEAEKEVGRIQKSSLESLDTQNEV